MFLQQSEVERRGRRAGVGAWCAGDELVRSVRGFLSDDETLADLLAADDQAVRVQLGLDHHQLATQLDAVLRCLSLFSSSSSGL